MSMQSNSNAAGRESQGNNLNDSQKSTQQAQQSKAPTNTINAVHKDMMAMINVVEQQSTSFSSSGKAQARESTQICKDHGMPLNFWQDKI